MVSNRMQSVVLCATALTVGIGIGASWPQATALAQQRSVQARIEGGAVIIESSEQYPNYVAVVSGSARDIDSRVEARRVTVRLRPNERLFVFAATQACQGGNCTGCKPTEECTVAPGPKPPRFFQVGNKYLNFVFPHHSVSGTR